MAKVQIFNDSIIVDSFFNPEVDAEILRVLDEEKKGKGVLKSNFGGFQTDKIENKIINNNILQKIVKCITENYDPIVKTKFEMLNLWINENPKNAFNLPHIHPNSHFSGVYYLVVSENKGEIIFSKEGGLQQVGLSDFFISQDFYNSYTIKPKKGMLLIFPSSLSHMVTPHLENINRISVSFNIGLSNG